jgi:hypothetical protein
MSYLQVLAGTNAFLNRCIGRSKLTLIIQPAFVRSNANGIIDPTDEVLNFDQDQPIPFILCRAGAIVLFTCIHAIWRIAHYP